MPDSFLIKGAGAGLTACVYEPVAARHTLVLGHGAGAGQQHPWMRARAEALSTRGVRVVTFDFPYITAGRRAPDRAPVLLGSWRAAVESIVGRFDGGQAFAIGGKSMGGRMATMLMAEADAPVAVHGVVALGYPLHPPGRPGQLRVAHLGRIRVPVLVVQGERDPFGGPDEIAREFAVAGARPHLVSIPFGGHGFEVRARDAKQSEVYDHVAEIVARWLDTLQGAGPS